MKMPPRTSRPIQMTVRRQFSGKDCIIYVVQNCLRSYLNRRPNPDQGPDFLDLGVVHGNTPVGPIYLALQTADPSECTSETMYFDIATWFDSCLSGSLLVDHIWIRDVQGKIESAVQVLGVDHVLTLRHSMVAFPFLRTDGCTAERNLSTSLKLCHRASR